MSTIGRGIGGLLVCMLSGVAAASLISVLLIFVLPGGAGSIDETLPQTGPLGLLISRIVPFVWVGLFAGLGASFWLVSRGRASPGRAGWAIVGLVVGCMVYPVVATTVQQPGIAIAGNVLTIAAALVVARVCWPESRLAGVFPLLVATWVSLATAGLVALLLKMRF